MKEKTCSCCKTSKALDDFGKQKGRKFDRKSQCRICVGNNARLYNNCLSTRIRKRAHARLDQTKAQQKQYFASPTRRKARRAANVKDRTDHPDKWAARSAVGHAVRDGRLTRLPCQVCGTPKVEGHHHSYAPEHWLDVVWLCRRHHREVHRKDYSGSIAAP